MNRTTTATALLCIATIALASGCTSDSPSGSASKTTIAAPTATTTMVPGDARQLADRYRKAGGDADVYGIQQTQDKDGFPVLTVWTRKKAGYEPFDNFASELASFLDQEGVRLDQGYVLNVYAPDGTRLHNYDTRPESNS
ncbi:hypothetical protein [Streptomyces sp. NPDC005907]|uniref:hypothetical protein n=1 Tax=Streptomyces sp. NPDC005907 TaxID=3154571 RepID=UPI0033D7B2AE